MTRNRTDTKADQADRAARDAEMVVIRLLEVAERNPRMFDPRDENVDAPGSPYSVDLLDGLSWAVSALENAVRALPNADTDRPHMLERLATCYTPQVESVYVDGDPFSYMDRKGTVAA